MGIIAVSRELRKFLQVWLVSHTRGIFRQLIAEDPRRGPVIENFKRIARWPLCAAEEKFSRDKETNNCRLCAKFRRTKVTVATNEEKMGEREKGGGGANNALMWSIQAAANGVNEVVTRGCYTN